MAGALMVDAARRRGVAILPVDSEHNAIHQCLHGRAPRRRAAADPDRLRRPVPHARAARELARVTPADALRHPTWRMGRKITIDSATLMNKGLEVIEARWLFGVAAGADRRRHPPAVDRALDGRVPRRIGDRAARRHRHAAADPVRVLLSGALGRRRCRRSTSRGCRPLEFEPPDPARFPCLRPGLPRRSSRAAPGRSSLNAANEVAVEAFLAGRFGFRRFRALIERALDAADRDDRRPATSLADVRADRRLGARLFRRNYRYATIVVRECRNFVSTIWPTIATSVRFSSSSACSSSCTSWGTSSWRAGTACACITFSLGFGPKLFKFRAATPSTASAPCRSAAT